MKKPIIIKPASREEWLKAREDGIGASEVACIIGQSPWKSAFELWLLKTKQVAAPTEETEVQKWGHRLEDDVADEWEERTGGKYVKSSAKDNLYIDPEHPWRKCTPDRIAYEIGEDGKKHKVLLEIKTSQIDFDPDNLPIQYLCQVNYQMHITGIHVCYLCWLVRGAFYGQARIEYDKEFAEFLVSKVDEFWNDCVVGGKEPELVTVQDFTIKGSDPGTTIEADEEAIRQIKVLRLNNQVISERETLADEVKDQLKLFMGQAESLVYEGKVLATWKTGTRGRTFLLKAKAVDELLEQDENNG